MARIAGIAGAGVLLMGLGACAELPFGAPAAPGAPDAPLSTIASLPEGADPSPGTEGAPPPDTAVTVEEFDTTSAAERAAAAAPPPRGASATAQVTEAALGTTIASLGNPAEPGFWAETPLVSAVRPGRLTDPATGKSVQVELRPSGGAAGTGTRVSLPALRVLGVALTDLPQLSVTGL